MKFKVPAVVVIVTLLALYLTLVSLLMSWYEFTGARAKGFSSVPYLLQVCIFLMICSSAYGLRRMLFCALSIFFLACTYGWIHLYYSTQSANIDWKGVDGAIAVFFVQGLISVFICIVALVVVVFFSLLRKAIKEYSRGIRH